MQLAGQDAPQRATGLADLVGRLDSDYDSYADTEREGKRITADNAWLGASVLIHEELHRMRIALQERAAKRAPEF